MTLHDFFQFLGQNPSYVLMYFAAIPLVALLANIMGKGEGANYVATGNQIRTGSSEPAVILEFASGDGIFSHNECYREGGGDAADVRLQSNTLMSPIIASPEVASRSTSAPPSAIIPYSAISAAARSWSNSAMA